MNSLHEMIQAVHVVAVGRLSGASVRRRMAWLGGTAAVCSIAMAAPPSEAAESLTIWPGAEPTVNEPLNITVEGVADGAHRLYVYVNSGGEPCAHDPYEEHGEGFEEVTPLGEEGNLLAVGSFSEVYTYTPKADNEYGVCAYLDDAPSDPPDAASQAYFTTPSGVVRAPYLLNPQLQEELKRIAVEAEQRKRAQVKEQEEQELRERQALEPASERTEPAEQVVAKEEHKTSGAGNVCIVPSLKGYSLVGARTALRKAHCKLGRIRIPGEHHKVLVVMTQSPARGTKLPRGAAVAVTLRPRRG